VLGEPFEYPIMSSWKDFNSTGDMFADGLYYFHDFFFFLLIITAPIVYERNRIMLGYTRTSITSIRLESSVASMVLALWPWCTGQNESRI